MSQYQDLEKVDQMLVQTIVLLERQYFLTQNLIEAGQEKLHAMELSIFSNKQNVIVVMDVFNYCFGLIDNLVRFQKIAFSLPRFNQADPEFRALNQAMGNLKNARNVLQHINNHIMNDFKGPLLGMVCWVSGQNQFMASFNDIGRKRTSPGLIYDTQEKKFVHEFCYVYDEKYYDLGLAITGMRTFYEHISQNIELNIEGKKYDPKEHYIAACISFGDV